MKAPATRDTIFALSSGAPPAAIAIVRVSGPAAREVLRRLSGLVPPPRHAQVAALRDVAGALLDRALILWFPGPGSATGEDLAELHLHGGRAVVAAVQAALARVEGCRRARPGEFTRRAFANGRIDLLQAEGLADLLQAESEGARRQALRAAEGGLSRVVGGWRERLLVLSARAEAVLEFGADDPDILPDPTLVTDITALAAEFDEALAQPPAERLRDGLRIVVAGPPNAGKSTLVNALAGREVALATPVAGTTRDLVEAPLLFGGAAVILVDSAGLRVSDDPVEQLGVARAEAAVAGADIVLWLGKPEGRPAGIETLVVHAQADLPEREAPLPGADVSVSAVSGAGMELLRSRLYALVADMMPATDVAWVEAQRMLIVEARDALRRATQAASELLVAEELRICLDALDGLTGRRNVEGMLDRLFDRFCIGK